MMNLDEGDKCPKKCGGVLFYPPITNCSCHINPPCSACLSVKLTCNGCGEEIKGNSEIQPWFSYTQPGHSSRKVHQFREGVRIFNWGYDSSSGSTMVYTGEYEGEVTKEDIISYFGDGTFGHRGPSFYNGRFTYTKITD